MAENKKPIMEEVATTADGKDVTRGYLDPLSIQPVNDSVLTLRGGGDFKIYSEILRDDQVATSFNQRRLAVVGKNWQVEAGGTSRKDKAAADYLREQLQNIGWDNVTDKMLYGVFYGFGVAEAMYVRDGQHIALADVKVRNRRRFGYDGLNRLRMRTPAQPMGELLPARKFWNFSCGADNDDDAYGLGLGHWLYWPAFFKRNGLKYWLLFLEKFGQPTAVGKYNANNTDPAQKQKLLQALQAIATDSGITVPEGMIIELLEAKRSGTGDYATFYDKMDAAISKVVLGQTASTQGTPGRLGNDELQSDVRLDIIKADADLVCESFNRSIVRWLVDWNFPGAMPPRVYRKVEPDEDTAKRAERDSKVFGMGYKPSLQYVQENYGDGWEEKPQTPPPAKTSATPQFAAADMPAPQQMLEQTRTTLAPATNAWINQVRELANSASDMEDLRDKLLTAYPDMSLEQYADALANATVAANLAGRDDVKPGAN
ncbi:DUF935 domain-containing protein [Rheinheimera baltica]|uniref:DUF935 domain-containing protein n=1 Tax=Rheinheimera baltica TaxID=67576 RepID=UPI0003F7BFD1|nr:DUF935 family protein [Rheinheimera baltica]